MKVLVIAAHSDDEILGVGGTILKHISNGDDVFICIVTKGWEPLWTKSDIEEDFKQQKNVDDFLKIKKRIILDYLAVKLNTISHGVFNKKITDIVDEINPDIVYTHYENDLNYDHTLVFRACQVATRPPKKIRLICFEVLSQTEWNNKPFQPNLWVNIEGFLEKKIEAFKFYKSEMKEYPHPRSPEGIEALARKRGSEICVEFSEAFIIVRDYW